MADEITAVGLGFDTDDFERAIRRAERRLDDLEDNLDSTTRAADRQQRAFDGLGRKVVGLAAAYGAFRGLEATSRFLFETNREFEQLEARLVSITGSVEAADTAFGIITDFARETPFEVQNLVQAFTTLNAAGIAPTTDQLRGLGNFAAAMGRDITDLVEAILRASQGGTERLRESFFIPIQKEGEKLVITWRGQAQEVQADAGELLTFFQRLGEQEFADGMARQMQTLDGAISNLQDSSSLLAREIGRAGLTGELTDLVRRLDEAIADGNEFAEVIGENLAGGVRVGAAALEAMIRHLDLVVVGFEALAGAATGAAIAGAIANLGRVRSALLGITAAMAANPVTAVLTLAGAIGGPLLFELLTARDAAERLNSEFDRMGEAIPKLSGEALQRQLEAVDNAIAAQQDAAARFSRAARTHRRSGAGTLEESATRSFQAATRQLGRLQQQRARIVEEMQARSTLEGVTFTVDTSTADALERVVDLRKQLAQQAASSRSAIDNLVDSLWEENILLEDGAEALLVWQLASKGASAEDVERALRLQRTNQQLKERAEREREAAEAARRAREEQARNEREARESAERVQLAELEAEAQHLQTVADRMAGEVTEAFEDIIGGTENVVDAFTDMVDGILEQLSRLVIQQIITQPLAQAISNALTPIPATPDPVPAPAAPPNLPSGPSGTTLFGGPAPAASGQQIVNFHQVVHIPVNAIDGADAARFVRANKGEIAGVVGEAAQESLSFRRTLVGG